MIRVTFHTHDGKDHTIEPQPGKTVMAIARENSLPGVIAECDGSCACATCHVCDAENRCDRLPGKDDMGSDMLDFASEQNKTSRLSCQITLIEQLDGLTVRIPEEQA